jgi:hypothetical protein
LIESDEESENKDENKSETQSEEEETEIKHFESVISKEDKEEISQLFKNIKVSLTDYNQKVTPVSQIASENKLESSNKYFNAKGSMIKTYLAYQLLYGLLKAKGILNDHHPIITKLIYLKSLLDKSKRIDDSVMPELVNAFDEEEEELEDGSDDELFEENEKILKQNENKLNQNRILQDDSDDDVESHPESITAKNTKMNSKMHKNNGNQFDSKMLGKKKNSNYEIEEDKFYKENVESLKKTKEKLKDKEKKMEHKLKAEIAEKERLGQRVANENIIKSRGLYRKRKKYQGNAKLHLREKFHKKMLKRKNYVKEYTGKPLNYAGEATGIRDDLVRATKLH